jgi:hypothetical protein
MQGGEPVFEADKPSGSNKTEHNIDQLGHNETSYEEMATTEADEHRPNASTT